MPTVVEPLRDEHKRFTEPLEAIRQAAERVGELPLLEVRSQIDDVHAFLVERFIPHSRAEEATEPLVDAEVRRLDDKLLALRERLVYSYFDAAEIRSLRELLYDLYAIIRLHTVKEETAAEVTNIVLHVATG